MLRQTNGGRQHLHSSGEAADGEHLHDRASLMHLAAYTCDTLVQLDLDL